MSTRIRNVVSALRQAGGLPPFSDTLDVVGRPIISISGDDINPRSADLAASIEAMARDAGLSYARLELLRLGVERRTYLQAKIQEACDKATAGRNALDPELRSDPRRNVNRLDEAIQAAAAFLAKGGQVAEHIEALKFQRAAAVREAEPLEAELERLEKNRAAVVNPAQAELAYLETIIPEVFDKPSTGIIVSLSNPRTPIEKALSAVAADSIAA